MQNKLIIKGARQHNLKNINVEIPRDKLVVITGLSGSGKSSLAFDTIYAEGQRRYVESLSSYARQFLGQIQDSPHSRPWPRSSKAKRSCRRSSGTLPGKGLRTQAQRIPSRNSNKRRKSPEQGPSPASPGRREPKWKGRKVSCPHGPGENNPDAAADYTPRSAMRRSRGTADRSSAYRRGADSCKAS